MLIPHSAKTILATETSSNVLAYYLDSTSMLQLAAHNLLIHSLFNLHSADGVPLVSLFVSSCQNLKHSQKCGKIINGNKPLVARPRASSCSNYLHFTLVPVRLGIVYLHSTDQYALSITRSKGYALKLLNSLKKYWHWSNWQKIAMCSQDKKET